MAVTLYGLESCPFTRRLRERLDGEGRDYSWIDVERSPQVIPELRKLTDGRRVVPVLVDGVTIAVAPEGEN